MKLKIPVKSEHPSKRRDLEQWRNNRLSRLLCAVRHRGPTVTKLARIAQLDSEPFTELPSEWFSGAAKNWDAAAAQMAQRFGGFICYPNADGEFCLRDIPGWWCCKWIVEPSFCAAPGLPSIATMGMFEMVRTK